MAILPKFALRKPYSESGASPHRHLSRAPLSRCKGCFWRPKIPHYKTIGLTIWSQKARHSGENRSFAPYGSSSKLALSRLTALRASSASMSAIAASYSPSAADENVELTVRSLASSATRSSKLTA